MKQSVLEFQRFITLTAVYTGTVSFYITKAQYTIAKTCVAQTFLIKYMLYKNMFKGKYNLCIYIM